MKRLFRVQNTSSSWWMLADDAQDAIEVSWQAKKARAKKNLEIIADQTDEILNSENAHNLKELLEGDDKGFVGLRIPSRSFADALNGVPPKGKHEWILISVAQENT